MKKSILLIRITIIASLLIGFGLIGFGITKIIQSDSVEDVAISTLEKQHLSSTSMFNEPRGLQGMDQPIFIQSKFFFDWNNSYPGLDRDANVVVLLCPTSDSPWILLTIFHEDELSIISELGQKVLDNDSHAEVTLGTYRSEKAWSFQTGESMSEDLRTMKQKIIQEEDCRYSIIEVAKLRFTTPGNYYYHTVARDSFGAEEDHVGGPIINIPSRSEEIDLSTNLAVIAQVSEQRKSNLLIEGLSWIATGAIPIGIGITLLDRFIWYRSDR